MNLNTKVESFLPLKLINLKQLINWILIKTQIIFKISPIIKDFPDAKTHQYLWDYLFYYINLLDEENIFIKEIFPRDKGSWQPYIFNLFLQHCTLGIPSKMQTQIQNIASTPA